MSGVPPTTPPAPAGSGGSSGGQQRKPPEPEQGPLQDRPPAAGHKPAVSYSASLVPVSAGQRLDGQIVTSEEGRLFLRTDSGTFILTAKPDIVPNAQVVLQVLTVGTELRAALLASNGQPLHPPVQIVMELAQPLLVDAQKMPQTPAGNATAPSKAMVLQAGTAVSARVIAPGTVTSPLATQVQAYGPAAALTGEAGVTAMPPASEPLAVGTTLLLHILGVTTPAVPGAKIATATATASTTASGGGTQPGPPVPAAAPPGGNAAAGTSTAGTSITATATARPAADTLTGIVTGQAAPQQILLRTPNGLLAMETRTPLPRGTLVTARIISQSLPEGEAAPPLLGTLAGGLALSGPEGRWPALKRALEVLATLDPGLAGRMAKTRLPMPGQGLASGLLFFLNAIRGGDPRRWLGGDASKLLEKGGRGDLLQRIGDDFQQMGRTMQDQSGEWRTLFFPIFDGKELYRLSVYYRHQGRKGDGEGGIDSGTRFVLDLEFTKLGALQIDGLVRNRRFDLYLRSQTSLTPAVRRDVSEIFSEALEIGGMTGDVVFQKTGTFPVSPLAEIRASGGHHGVLV